MTGTIKRLGFALLIGGALLLVTGTMGFSAVSAERTASITVADDPDAYLGIVDNSGSSDADVTDTSTGELYYLYDNVGSYDTTNVAITIESIDYGDGTATTNPDLTVTIRNADLLEGVTQNYDLYVEISCDEGSTESGIGHLTVVFDASDTVSVLAERTTNQTINVDCTS